MGAALAAEGGVFNGLVIVQEEFSNSRSRSSKKRPQVYWAMSEPDTRRKD